MNMFEKAVYVNQKTFIMEKEWNTKSLILDYKENKARFTFTSIAIRCIKKSYRTTEDICLGG